VDPVDPDPQHWLFLLRCFRDAVRQIPGVPLIYLHGNAPTLERPSALTERLTARISDGKTALSLHQKQIIAALRDEIIGPKNEPLAKGRW
jgi:hypothetical protein